MFKVSSTCVTPFSSLFCLLSLLFFSSLSLSFPLLLLSSFYPFLTPLVPLSLLRAAGQWDTWIAYLRLYPLPYPTKRPMATVCPINLESFNCRGFNVPEKRSQILYQFHKMRSNILLIQEMHYHTGSIPALGNRYYHNWFHSTNPHAKSKVVYIAFHKSFNPEVLDSLIDVTGHFIFLKLKLNNFLFTLGKIYAPNMDQARFLSSVPTRLSSFGGYCFIISGELNIAHSPSADTSSDKSFVPFSSLTCIKSLLHSSHLVYVWHIQHTTESDYSHYSAVHNSYSRLDHFLISQSLLDTTLQASIGHLLWSDQAPVYLTLTRPPR